MIDERLIQIRHTLAFYRDEAAGAQRAIERKDVNAMTAILTVLSLDAGRRAEEALSIINSKDF